MDDIIKSVDLPDGRAVLFAAANELYRSENLAYLDWQGALRWRAHLPATTGPDSFVDIALDGPDIRAITWSGWTVWLDQSTGAVLKSAFVK